jgi:hypothetical protein
MKISELTQVAEISRDIKLPLSVDGKNFNVTVGQILDAAQAQLPDATGKAGGLATLDDNSLIPVKNIPATALSDVIEFGGTVSGVDAETRGGTMTAEGSDGTTIVAPALAKLPSGPTTLLYDTENKRLVVREIDSFTVGGKIDLETGTTSEPTPAYKYTYWAANDTEDTSNVAQYYRTMMRPGGVPYAGKVYINTATGQLYRWNGSDLVEVGSVVKIGTTEGTAFDGAEGNNLRTEVTSLTSRVAGIAIVPFDGFWSGDTAYRPAGGVRYNTKNDTFLIASLPEGYMAEDYLDTSDADNVVIRQDVIFRHDNALYAFNGTTLVAVASNAEQISENKDAIKVNADAIELLQNSVNKGNDYIDTLLKDLGYYGDIAAEELSLEIDESGYAVNTSGAKVAMSGYAISKPIALTQGNIYLIKAQAVDSEVSMFARRSQKEQTDHISYTYTYNVDGQPLTATADYDNSVVYQYNYTENVDTDGTVSYKLESITLNGEEVEELPSSRTYTVEVYNALFKTGAIATPKSGYYVYFCPTSMEIIVSAKESDLTADASDETRGKMYGVRYGIFASIASNYVNRWERDELDNRISALEEIHEQDAYNEKNYCVGAWVSEDLSPDSIKTYGDETMLYNAYHKVLIDATDNAGTYTTPVGELNDENLLRFSDGRFAPAVAITEEQFADSQLELYRLIDGEYTLYCEAGAYNAETYLEEVLRPIVTDTPNNLTAAKLYKKVDEEFVEAHALLPWETTETKYNQCIANKYNLYLIDGVVGKSGYQWKGLFNYPAVWDGVDLSPYKLAPTAICLSPVAVVGGKTRSFFHAYAASDASNSVGGKGMNDYCSEFDGDGTYPRVCASQIDDMVAARANNADTKAPYPCAEGGFHAYNTLLNALETANHTKYLRKNTRYGSGISSADTCNSEATMLLNGGVRYRTVGSDTWSYANFNNNPRIYAADKSATNLSHLLNYYRPKEQCMESQIAYSWAKEFGIAEQRHFSMYGGEYWYIDNAEAQSGKMNARVYRRRAFTMSAYDANGDTADYELEVILRMSLYAGLRCTGDIFVYRGGGQESIGTNNGESSRQNCVVKMYSEFDQTRWVYDQNATLANLGTFTAEKTYRYLGSYLNKGEMPCRQRQSYAPDCLVRGGDMLMGECYYTWQTRYWTGTLNTRARIALLFGYGAIATVCAPRSVCCNYAVSANNTSYAVSAQFLVQP